MMMWEARTPAEVIRSERDFRLGMLADLEKQVAFHSDALARYEEQVSSVRQTIEDLDAWLAENEPAAAAVA